MDGQQGKQHHEVHPQKGTPARRRPRKSMNSAARKTYASESDMPSEPFFPNELLGPLTPQKSASNSPAPTSTQPKTRHRNGNKARAKQVSSPGPAKQGRTTPPQTAAPKPIAAPAFAGATFHASPEPSSLPIPSFLSRAALDSPSVRDTDGSSREPSPPATDSEATPQHRLLSTGIAREESPLDIFFRADRAEREQARRASFANILGPNLVPFSPPARTRSPTEPKTVPSELLGARNRRPGLERNSSSGIPVSELDGTPGRPVGPAFSKPYLDRIREARSGEKQAPPAQPHPTSEPAAPLDMTERLKRFLAIPSVQSEQQSHSQTSLQVSPQVHPRVPAVSPGSTSLPSPFSTASHPVPSPSLSNPPVPKSPDDSRSSEILNMEDSLRRMLGLYIGPTGAAPPTNYQSS